MSQMEQNDIFSHDFFSEVTFFSVKSKKENLKIKKIKGNQIFREKRRKAQILIHLRK